MLALCLLLMSGLQIFNAHPALYIGQASDFDHPILSMYQTQNDKGDAIGVTTLFGHAFITTGVLGSSAGDMGPDDRGFPSWATIPSDQDLTEGRLWHFFFAWVFVINGLVYLVFGLISRHLRRDLVPSPPELGHIGRDIVDHALLRFPKGEAARRYNVLQKLTYLIVIFVLLPLMVLAGLALAPRIDAGFPWLLAIFGGRQSARTVHFVIANLLVLFTIIHVVMVLLSGVWNNLRSMVTGRYVIRNEVENG